MLDRQVEAPIIIFMKYQLLLLGQFDRVRHKAGRHR
jgi:hypothetical protein